MTNELDDEKWPVELAELVSDPRFAARVSASARKRFGNVLPDEVFDGISSFVVRALEVRENAERAGLPDNFLNRFPSSFSVVRYIVLSIRNERIRKKESREREEPISEFDPEKVEIDERSLLEDAIMAYLAQFESEEIDETVEDPAGLSKVERTVIAFRWQGFTLQEIAEKTSSSASTVHRIEKHAIAKLKAWLFGDS